MCRNPDQSPLDKPKHSAASAARDLASLIQGQLEVSIPPVALQLFIRAYWSRIAPLAHAIHEKHD